MIETTCRGQAALYQRICEEFVGVAAAKEALAILAESDSKRKKVSAQGGTVEGKKKTSRKESSQIPVAAAPSAASSKLHIHHV